MYVALAALEPALIAPPEPPGASWQGLGPVLGVARRQAAERRYATYRGVRLPGPATRC
jgi:hypothetical protein